MDVTNGSTPGMQPAHRMRKLGSAGAANRDLAVMRVRDFTSLMKLIAEHDLWDEMEKEMAALGCTNFRIGAQPMRTAGAILQRKIGIGDLPPDTIGLFADWCSCVGSNKGGGGTDAGTSGGSSGTLKPGTSQGDPQDGGVGSKDKAQ